MRRMENILGRLIAASRRLCTLLLSATVASTIAWTQSVSWLGTLGGNEGEAQAVSADGSVVVGWARNAQGQVRAFRWTHTTGMYDLGTLGGNNSQALDVSADGSVVVGWAEDSQGRMRAFRWTQSTGMVDLGTLGGNESSARGISPDGNTIVGWAHNSSGVARAFYLQSGQSITEIDTRNGSNPACANDVVGNLVIGEYQDSQGRTRAFSWNGYTSNIPDLGGGSNVAQGISPDGSVIVGSAVDSNGRHVAFRYSSWPNRSIGFLDARNYAQSATPKGFLIVGYSTNQNLVPQRAFLWTPHTGMQDLNTVYQNILQSSTLLTALDVSHDGLTIVGQGLNAAMNRKEPYILRQRLVPRGKLLWLGTPPDSTKTTASAMTADGSVVVVNAYAGIQSKPYRWTRNDRFQPLPADSNNARAVDISDSGQIIVGEDGDKMVRWNNGIREELGILYDEGDPWWPGDGFSRSVVAVSGNGQTIVFSEFRETDEGGCYGYENWDSVSSGWLITGSEWRSMGRYTGTPSLDEVHPRGVSYNGNTIVGYLSYDRTNYYENEDGCHYGGYTFYSRPFIWTNGQYRLIGNTDGFAYAVNRAGSIVALTRDSGNGSWVAALWNASSNQFTSMGGFMYPTALTDTGSFVVGYAYLTSTIGQETALYWNANDGIQYLNSLCADQLVNGSHLQIAKDISADGRYIIGTGYNNATGRTEAFIIDTQGCVPVNGDVTRNGCVDDADLLQVLFAFGQSGTGLSQDLNCDDTVDDADLLLVLFNFGSGC